MIKKSQNTLVHYLLPTAVLALLTIPILAHPEFARRLRNPDDSCQPTFQLPLAARPEVVLASMQRILDRWLQENENFEVQICDRSGENMDNLVATQNILTRNRMASIDNLRDSLLTSDWRQPDSPLNSVFDAMEKECQRHLRVVNRCTQGF